MTTGGRDGGGPAPSKGLARDPEEATRDLEIPSPGGGFGGHLSTPPEGFGPGLLVLPEGPGLDPGIRAVCDRLARAGFVALAADLVPSASSPAPPTAARQIGPAELDRGGRALQAAADWLRRQPATEGARIGCIGFGAGGTLALHAAARVPGVAAVVDCYGPPVGTPPDFGTAGLRLLGLFAEHDPCVSHADVEALRAALEAAPVEHHLRVYPGTAPGFLNETRPDVFDAGASAEAWHEIRNFLEAALG